MLPRGAVHDDKEFCVDEAARDDVHVELRVWFRHDDGRADEVLLVHDEVLRKHGRISVRSAKDWLCGAMARRTSSRVISRFFPQLPPPPG